MIFFAQQRDEIKECLIMVYFHEIDVNKFLTEYWQKKPLLIRQALPDFVNALTADELAGLSMEEEIESRLVFETPEKAPYWHLKRGPFIAKDFKTLPETHWTLLVQGVDRFIPEVTQMLDYFNFIPQWRVDDVMISYAVEHGSVGPHYDNYDVFLYQAQGKRKWSLTTKHCRTDNYLPGVELRIMQQFLTEEEYILEEGDMLYLPPHVGHYGIAIGNDCMTYSFGYRSYQGQELLDSFADYLAEKKPTGLLYQDPDWTVNQGSAEITKQAWLNAKKLLQTVIDDESHLQHWFGCFVTQFDQQAETLLPIPLADEEMIDIGLFTRQLTKSEGMIRNASCRFAYQVNSQESRLNLFINGDEWPDNDVSPALIKLVCNHRLLTNTALLPFRNREQDLAFLFKLCQLQWLELID